MTLLLQSTQILCPLCRNELMGLWVKGIEGIVFRHHQGSPWETNPCPNKGKTFRLNLPTIEAEEIELSEEVPA